MAKNTFRHGQSTYACDVCGRRTRHTGVQAVGSQLCPQCWDLAGLENEISDGNATVAEHADQVRRLMREITKLGGKPSFDYQGALDELDNAEPEGMDDGTQNPESDARAKLTVDEAKVYDLIMSRGHSMERADIKRLTALGEERCYVTLRKMVADGVLKQEIRNGRTNGRPTRVAHYSIA